MDLMDKVISLCKRRGFIFQSSDIYGGLANTWDYGPYGIELKNNVKRAWWRTNVHGRDDIFGVDAAILMNPRVWTASGHVNNFADIYLDCKECKKRFKADDIQGVDIKETASSRGNDVKIPPQVEYTVTPQAQCPVCGARNFTDPRSFNLMFETHMGPTKDHASVVYLRPETAQGMFVNFENIINSRHPKLPFGMAQIGKAFRNEITPGNFIFRTREFEQMEIEYFVRPEEADEKLKEWIENRFNWYLNMGIKKENLRKRIHEKTELAHYAKACTDIEYNFPFSTRGSNVSGGWSELEGIANRTDFDLKQHAEYSGKDLTYSDDIKKERFFPYIIEPSGGVDRSLLAFMVDAYTEEKVNKDTRVVLKLHKDLAPVKAAVLPLLRNRPEIVEVAKKLSQDLKKSFYCVYDDTGAIGKLYRRQDEVGTLYCITVDVQTLEDKQVTVRDRDTMQQERINLDKVKEYLFNKLSSAQ